MSILAGCSGCEPEETRPSSAPEPTHPEPATPEHEASVQRSPEVVPPAPTVEVMPEPRCRPEMVKVTPEHGRAFCVDRYEAMLLDHLTSAVVSPYYAPSRRAAVLAFDHWERKRHESGSAEARTIGLPTLPAWQRERSFEPRAAIRKGVVPNGHVSGQQAELACRNANKRLCRPDEWRIACGGEQGWKFPYGPEYVHGKCNVFREAHPAAVLHGNPSIGHTDPRLNRVTVKGRPLLRKTGATPSCASRWGDDAIYDMVGNLDEWVEHEKGSFAGGFYARATREGCDWRSTAHPNHYADYSTGVRCCTDL